MIAEAQIRELVEAGHDASLRVRRTGPSATLHIHVQIDDCGAMANVDTFYGADGVDHVAQKLILMCLRREVGPGPAPECCK